MKAGDGNGVAEIVLAKTIKIAALYKFVRTHDGHRQPTPPHIAMERVVARSTR